MTASSMGLVALPATGLPAGVPGPSSPAESGEAFSALVEESLASGRTSRRVGDQATADLGAGDDGAAEETGQAAADELAALLAGLLAPVPAGLALALAGGTGSGPVPAEAAAPVKALLTGLPASDAAVVDVAAGTTDEQGPSLGLPAAAGAPAPDLPPAAAPTAAPHDATSDSTSPAPLAPTTDASATPPGVPQPGQDPLAPDELGAGAAARTGPATGVAAAEGREAARPAPAADPATVPVIANGAVTVTTAPGAQAALAAERAPVAAQVIPEITRLVSDGEGVHRVTLALNPRALGEVRVTLTMRNGEVHVRLAAGEQARASLASSSSELSRALHGLGVEGTRITLTDLQGGAATTTHTSSDDHPGGSRHQTPFPGGFESDSHGHNGHHSRMSDDHAMDGSSTSTPADRARAAARIQPVGHARVAGDVDLRM